MPAQPKKHQHQCQIRSKIAFSAIIILLLLIELRLFYWQVLQGDNLKTQAQEQTVKTDTEHGSRGKIYTADGHLLVGNQTVFSLSISKKELEIDQLELIKQLISILIEDPFINSQYQEDKEEALRNYLIQKIDSGSNWIQLATKIQETTAEKIKKLDDFSQLAVSLTPQLTRYYPEASLAAHLTGFVGKNDQGQDIGYFGVEGALNEELTGDKSTNTFKGDARGLRLAGQNLEIQELDGRDITLTIRRDVQHLIQQKLEKAIKKYEAKTGEIIVIEPATGKILGLATSPHYHPGFYRNFTNENYKNPSIANLYEPGSTFKTLTVAAGIDAGVITPETTCTNCDGPRVIGGYTIRTWNDVYHPSINMTEALEKSDNIAMIFVAEKLGADKFSQYLKKFGIGKNIDIDLQEDTDTPFPEQIGPVELATMSFGQGISLNSLQMVRAVNAIANQGKLMRLSVVEKVYDPQTDQTSNNEPHVVGQVISAQTAQQVTQMMVKSAQHGEAQWIGKHYSAAGKTGTSQIPSPDGGYKEDATIASFIGFAPPDNPQYLMLVKLIEPQSSPWAAETAAPLWFHTAEDLNLLLGVRD